MRKQLITRKFIIGRIDNLLEGEMSVPDFGDEMIQYLACDDKYELESGYE